LPPALVSRRPKANQLSCGSCPGRWPRRWTAWPRKPAGRSSSNRAGDRPRCTRWPTGGASHRRESRTPCAQAHPCEARGVPRSRFSFGRAGHIRRPAAADQPTIVRPQPRARAAPRWPAGVATRSRPTRAGSGSDRVRQIRPGFWSLRQRGPGGDKHQIGQGILALPGQGLRPQLGLALRACSQPIHEQFGRLRDRFEAMADGGECARRIVSGKDHGALDPSQLTGADVFRSLDHHLERVGNPGEKTRSTIFSSGSPSSPCRRVKRCPRGCRCPRWRHSGPQRLQGLRVVPVVEMAAMAVQGFHGVDGIGRAFHQPPGRKVAEVVGGQVREQRQPHVGRGSAVSDGRRRVLLHVVGWQPVVFRTDEGLEEGPGLSRNSAEEAGLGRCQPGDAAWEGTTNPPGQGRACEPEGQDGRGQDQRSGPKASEKKHHRCGQEAGASHRAKGGGEIGAAGFRIHRQIPFEKPPVADQHAKCRPHDRVEAEESLVRQTSEGKARLGEARSSRPA